MQQRDGRISPNTSMKTKLLLDSGILHSGETRPYSTWSMASGGRLHGGLPEGAGRARVRRSGCGGERMVEIRSVLMHWWQAFRRI